MKSTWDSMKTKKNSSQNFPPYPHLLLLLPLKFTHSTRKKPRVLQLSISTAWTMQLQSFRISLLLLLISTTVNVLALNQEGLFLLELKNSLSSDPSVSALSSWSSADANPCKWTGITCDYNSTTLSFPTVVAVNLTSASLSGPFSTSICRRLPSLSVLSLANNSINSSLPDSISLCRNLIYLDLSQNLLQGPIPYTLPDLPNLRYCVNLSCLFAWSVFFFCLYSATVFQICIWILHLVPV